MIIKDPLYGNIPLSELEVRIVDTPDFQRLRKIRQLAMTYMVYPGANHSRFEHSIGTMALASTICDSLNIEKEKKEQVRLYALLHDIGHVAFSHEAERALRGFIGDHEKVMHKKIVDGEIGDILKENYSPKKILSLERSAYGKIVNSDIGADRMDYLKRDAYYTGVAYGVIDSDRIAHTILLEKDELMIDWGGLEAAEALLIARFMMFSTVYLHHTVRICSAMLQQAISLAIEDGMKPEEFFGNGDEEMLLKLSGYPSARKYVSALRERRLLKQAFAFDAKIINERAAVKASHELSTICGCDVLIDYPYEFYKPVDFRVKIAGKAVSILKVSDLLAALKTSEEKRKKVIVLCPEENKEKVAKESRRLFS